VHPRERARVKEPIEEREASGADRIGEILAEAGAETVERDAEPVNPRADQQLRTFGAAATANVFVCCGVVPPGAKRSKFSIADPAPTTL
jgi:hypothetical protein